jgi:acetylornithine deacetylase/succinyl-diaminopimelate desuccinylase-like protein
VIIEGEGKNVMLYGHIDKQPHMEGWSEGLGAITPVVKNERLYGRGSSDDGYMPFASLLAIKNCQLQGAKLPRIVFCMETEEESASPSLVYLLGKVSD